MAFTVALMCFLSSLAACSGKVQLTHLSTLYLPYKATPTPLYGYAKPGFEQMAYHPGDGLIYGVGKEILHIINASDFTNLRLVVSMALPQLDVTDVAVCGDHVFMAMDSLTNRTQGLLRVYDKFDPDTSQMRMLHSVTVGAIPDMIYPRKGCGSVVVAVEAEAYVDNSGRFRDPESSVAIVTFPSGVTTNKHTVERLGFDKFNNRFAELEPSGVRFIYRLNDNPLSADLEPEYVAVDEERNEAFIVLQENNAIAKVDLGAKNITGIFGLGYKEWGHLDASDKDGGAMISYWPIRAWYLPDALKFHKWKGHRLLFSANEGDAKEYDAVNFIEEMKGGDFKEDDLSNNIHPMVKSALKDDKLLGRLTFSKYDGVNPKTNLYDALYTYGGRSFSIWDAETMSLIFDSGSDLEDMTALHCPHLFNAQFYTYLKQDVRSDNEGPEPTALAVAEIDDRLFIFIGNERPGTIAVYSIGSDAAKPRFETLFCGGIPNSGKTVTQLFNERILYAVSPEDLKFYHRDPYSLPVLFVLGSVSSTISVLEVKADSSPADASWTSACQDSPGGAISSLTGSVFLLQTTIASLVIQCVFVMIRFG